MSSALGNSKAVVALQKNPYFLKVAGYLMPLISVFNAVCSFSRSKTCVFSNSLIRYSEACEYRSVLLGGVVAYHEHSFWE